MIESLRQAECLATCFGDQMNQSASQSTYSVRVWLAECPPQVGPGYMASLPVSLLEGCCLKQKRDLSVHPGPLVGGTFLDIWISGQQNMRLQSTIDALFVQLMS